MNNFRIGLFITGILAVILGLVCFYFRGALLITPDDGGEFAAFGGGMFCGMGGVYIIMAIVPMPFQKGFRGEQKILIPIGKPILKQDRLSPWSVTHRPHDRNFQRKRWNNSRCSYCLSHDDYDFVINMIWIPYFLKHNDIIDQLD